MNKVQVDVDEIERSQLTPRVFSLFSDQIDAGSHCRRDCERKDHHCLLKTLSKLKTAAMTEMTFEI
jgi:hypothetical protein